MSCWTQNEIKPNWNPAIWRKRRIITGVYGSALLSGAKGCGQHSSKHHWVHIKTRALAFLQGTSSCVLMFITAISHNVEGAFVQGLLPYCWMTSMWSHFSIRPPLNHFSKNFLSWINKGLPEAMISCLGHRFLPSCCPPCVCSLWNLSPLSNNKQQAAASLHRKSVGRVQAYSPRWAMFVWQEC